MAPDFTPVRRQSPVNSRYSQGLSLAPEDDEFSVAIHQMIVGRYRVLFNK
jgi:hypothetical protein